MTAGRRCLALVADPVKTGHRLNQTSWPAACPSRRLGATIRQACVTEQTPPYCVRYNFELLTPTLSLQTPHHTSETASDGNKTKMLRPRLRPGPIKQQLSVFVG